MKTLLILLISTLMISCGTATKPSTPVTYGERIELLQPDLDGGLPINRALSLRASSRDFSDAPLSLEELSEVLWAAAGVNRPDGHLTAPSAIGLYPVSLYAFTPEGVYLYSSADHTLTRVAEGDHRELSAAQDFAFVAPLNIVYIADLGKYNNKGIPREKAEYLCGQDAAGYAENVNLYAAGHNLKAITRGSLRSAEVLELLGLGEEHVVVLAQTVGK